MVNTESRSNGCRNTGGPAMLWWNHNHADVCLPKPTWPEPSVLAEASCYYGLDHLDSPGLTWTAAEQIIGFSFSSF